ncbi:MAG TPA: TetR/AcrR family transcriptional regulator [Ktedonobacterales bacterium]|nr:TetR/AcrR family transcriptional regulator [Ktedonobacterales bacterium]
MATSSKPVGHDAPPGTRPQPERQEEIDERQQREERILDAAAALLMRWGYRKTTIDDVAREAGVGKGTIYLHWKDKNELFRAAIWRESQKATDDMKQRLAADPEGGLFHRVWTHGMLAVFSNQLIAALMKGNSDIFQGLLGAFDQKTISRLFGNAEEYITRLQQAGLIRADLPVSVITFLIGSLKLGIINAGEVGGQEHMPSTEVLTEAISDLMRRWLEPEHPEGDSDTGKHIMAEWLDKTNEIGTSSISGGR